MNAVKREIYEKREYYRGEQLSNKFKIEKLLLRGLNRMGENYQNVF